MRGLTGDLRVTLRGLRKSPTFTFAVVATIGLGIAVNAVMFAIADAVLLSPLPYPNPERLTMIWSDGETYLRSPLNGPQLDDLRRGSTLHESIAGIWATGGTLVGEGSPEPLRVGMVTANFLPTLGVPPARGRWFTRTDEGEGASPAVVISAELWERRFASGDVIGRRVRVDGGWGFGGNSYTIVGVMPVGFEMLLPLDSSVPSKVDAWIPFDRDLARDGRGSVPFLRAIGRVRAGATLAAAQDELARVGGDIVRNDAGASRSKRFYAVPLHDDLVKNARPALLVFQAAAGLVLLIACTNVANLLLVRAQARRRELAIRTALGAPVRRIASVLLIEGVVLSAGGGVLGVLLASAGLRLLPLLDPVALPRADTVAANTTVLVVSLLASGAAGILVGLAPLLDTWRRNLVLAFAGGSGPATGAPRARMRDALVVAEISLGVVLLISAGLMIRTFVNLRSVDPGYRSDRVLGFQLSLPFERYGDAGALARFTRELEHELSSVPGVEAAGAVNQLPLDDAPNWATAYGTRAGEAARETAIADARLVTPGYFKTLQATIAAGRAFTEQDDESRPLVLIVDERLALKTWPGRDPIGQEVSVRVWTIDQGFAQRWGTVVGVLRHVRHHRLAEEVREQVFVPFAQAPRPQMGVLVRTGRDIDPQDLMRAVAARISTLDASLVPARMRSLDQSFGRSRAPARVSMVIAALFAGLALLLACVGLYGVVAYASAQRMPELAVRVAMGARRGDLVRLVVGHGAVLTFGGVTLGLLLAMGAARLLERFLFGVTPFDAATFVAASLVLAAAALVACYQPARRAAAVDPVTVLRSQ